MGLTELLFKLRRTMVGDAIYRNSRNLMQSRGWGGFHRDRIYRGMILDLLEGFPFTSFVETGTYHGYSTELVTSRFPKLPVYTCEVMPATHHATMRYLKKFANIKQSLASSDQWIEGLLKAHEIGATPLFFLDAHWQHYWPLRLELKHISEAKLKTAIVIDDFEVPGHPEFGFDIDGGGEQIAGEKCNLDYILPSLNAANSYKAIFPKYSYADAFGTSRTGTYRGHILLFQNMDSEYEEVLNRPHIAKHYTGHGALAAAPTA